MFRENEEIQDGGSKMATIGLSWGHFTLYDANIFRSRRQRGISWTYYSKCHCHSFNRLGVMEGGGGGVELFSVWEQNFANFSQAIYS